jgi:hypothetical protein
MGVSDYRVQLSWRTSHKRRRLEKRLGKEAVLAVMDLWGWVAVNRVDGVLTGMDGEDIAYAAGWDGDHDRFIAVLCEPKIELLELNGEIYRIHDWEENQPYIVEYMRRGKIAKQAGKASAAARRSRKNVDSGSRSNGNTNPLERKHESVGTETGKSADPLNGKGNGNGNMEFSVGTETGKKRLYVEPQSNPIQSKPNQSNPSAPDDRFCGYSLKDLAKSLSKDRTISFADIVSAIQVSTGRLVPSKQLEPFRALAPLSPVELRDALETTIAATGKTQPTYLARCLESGRMAPPKKQETASPWSKPVGTETVKLNKALLSEVVKEDTPQIAALQSALDAHGEDIFAHDIYREKILESLPGYVLPPQGEPQMPCRWEHYERIQRELAEWEQK